MTPLPDQAATYAAERTTLPGGRAELAQERASHERALDAAPRWIPVTERLPERYIEVLVCFAGQMSLASTGQFTGDPHDIQGWCYPSENLGCTDSGADPVVTHWMPLPEVPTPTP